MAERRISELKETLIVEQQQQELAESILGCMLTYDPGQRISAHMALENHPYILREDLWKPSARGAGSSSNREIVVRPSASWVTLQDPGPL